MMSGQDLILLVTWKKKEKEDEELFLAHIYKYYLHRLNTRQPYSAIWSSISCSYALITLG